MPEIAETMVEAPWEQVLMDLYWSTEIQDQGFSRIEAFLKHLLYQYMYKLSLLSKMVSIKVDTEDEHIRANAKRLSQRLRGLKGHLTREVKNCTSKVGQFHTLMEQGAAQPVPANLQIMVEYAREIFR